MPLPFPLRWSGLVPGPHLELDWSGLVWAWSGTSCQPCLGLLSFRALAIIENAGPQARGIGLVTTLNTESWLDSLESNGNPMMA